VIVAASATVAANANMNDFMGVVPFLWS